MRLPSLISTLNDSSTEIYPPLTMGGFSIGEENYENDLMERVRAC